MHVLRAEKGYVIVGQETDGTVTPDDLGMGWIVNPSKGDFVGKRSLVRADTLRKDRKQLVALFPHDRAALVVEGTAISSANLPKLRADARRVIQLPSAILGRTFALAMLKDGRAMLTAPWAASGDRTIVCGRRPVVYDPEDRRRDG
jgi:sarcosine oxidase subunit alpha